MFHLHLQLRLLHSIRFKVPVTVGDLLQLEANFWFIHLPSCVSCLPYMNCVSIVHFSFFIRQVAIPYTNNHSSKKNHKFCYSFWYIPYIYGVMYCNAMQYDKMQYDIM